MTHNQYCAAFKARQYDWPMESPVFLTTSTFPRWEGDNEPSFIFGLYKELSKEFGVHALHGVSLFWTKSGSSKALFERSM